MTTVPAAIIPVPEITFAMQVTFRNIWWDATIAANEGYDLDQDQMLADIDAWVEFCTPRGWDAYEIDKACGLA